MRGCAFVFRVDCVAYGSAPCAGAMLGSWGTGGWRLCLACFRACVVVFSLVTMVLHDKALCACVQKNTRV
jgi:hypothetical protein